MKKLQGVVTERLAEGHGEAVFEVGYENNGESMVLTKDEFDVALARLIESAKLSNAAAEKCLFVKYQRPWRMSLRHG
jgi:GTPase